MRRFGRHDYNVTCRGGDTLVTGRKDGLSVTHHKSLRIGVRVEFWARISRLQPGEDDAHTGAGVMAFKPSLPFFGIVGPMYPSSHFYLLCGWEFYLGLAL